MPQNSDLGTDFHVDRPVPQHLELVAQATNSLSGHQNQKKNRPGEQQYVFSRCGQKVYLNLDFPAYQMTNNFQGESKENQMQPAYHLYHCGQYPQFAQVPQQWNQGYHYEQPLVQNSIQQGFQGVKVEDVEDDQKDAANGAVAASLETVNDAMKRAEEMVLHDHTYCVRLDRWTAKDVKVELDQQSTLSSVLHDHTYCTPANKKKVVRRLKDPDNSLQSLPKRVRLSETSNTPDRLEVLALPLRVDGKVSTLNLSKRITYEIESRNIPQLKFAKQVIGRTQGTLSSLLNRPVHWDALRSGKQTWLQMLDWLKLCEKDQMAVLEGKQLTCCVFGKPVKSFGKPPRTGRTVLTAEQKDALNKVLRQKLHPDKEDCEALAGELNLGINTVKYFFVNARKNAKGSYAAVPGKSNQPI